jgi:hypothetical protein
MGVLAQPASSTRPKRDPAGFQVDEPVRRLYLQVGDSPSAAASSALSVHAGAKDWGAEILPV